MLRLVKATISCSVHTDNKEQTVTIGFRNDMVYFLTVHREPYSRCQYK